MLGLKNKIKKKKSELNKMGRKLITISDSKSTIAEQFRTIRTSIKFSIPNTANLGVVLNQYKIPKNRQYYYQ